MAIPRLITVTGTVLDPAGDPVEGAVLTFSSNPAVRHGLSDDVMPAGQRLTQTTGADGEISLQVPATDDPDFTPTGWTWMYTLEVPGSPTDYYAVAVPYAAPGATVKLSELMPAASGQGMELYATLASLAGYLSAADLTAALADYLPVDGGAVEDGTLEVRKSDGSSGLRFRSTGGAVDVDKRNGDIVISSFAGPGYAGAQTGLMRLRADGITLSGLIEFGDTVYGGQQWLNTANASSGLAGATMTPAEAGLAGWTFDPATGVQGGTVVTGSGTSYVVRVRAMASSITNILMHLTAGGSALTAGQCFATLHNDAGVQLAGTADQAAAWASGGLKTMALTGGPVAVTRGSWYKVRFWFNGTTGPTVSRAVNSSTAIVNAGLSAPNFRYATADTGLTTLGAAPATIGTQTGGATAWWVGLS